MAQPMSGSLPRLWRRPPCRRTQRNASMMVARRKCRDRRHRLSDTPGAMTSKNTRRTLPSRLALSCIHSHTSLVKPYQQTGGSREQAATFLPVCLLPLVALTWKRKWDERGGASARGISRLPSYCGECGRQSAQDTMSAAAGGQALERAEATTAEPTPSVSMYRAASTTPNAPSA